MLVGHVTNDSSVCIATEGPCPVEVGALFKTYLIISLVRTLDCVAILTCSIFLMILLDFPLFFVHRWLDNL